MRTIPWGRMESQTFEPQPFQGEFEENYDFQSQDLIAFGKEMGLNLTELLNRKSRPPPGLFQTTLKLLDLYATPCIIIVGIIGNTLSLLVFSLTYLRRLSSSLYLSTLSVADIGFLLALSIVWLDRVNCFLFRRDIWCQAVVFTTKVCGFLAAWNVVTFTMERYITVYHPLRKDTLCTKQTARIVVTILSVLALFIYIGTAWTHGVRTIRGQDACIALPDHQNLFRIMSSIDTLISCLVPSLMIIALNCRIIVKIHRYQNAAFDHSDQPVRRTTKTRGSLTPGNRGSLVPGDEAIRMRVMMIESSMSVHGSMRIKFTTKRTKDGNSVTNDPRSRDKHFRPLDLGVEPFSEQLKKLTRGRSQFRTARMLLIISSVSVLLNFPFHAFRVHDFVDELIGGSAMASIDRFQWRELFQIVYFLNFAINFFIYSASNHQFRTGLARLCRRVRRHCRIRRCASTSCGKRRSCLNNQADYEHEGA